jgi:hypothetical protein
MKRFGLGDHKFDPNIAAHLSKCSSRICNDLTFINYIGGALYCNSEDYYHYNKGAKGIAGLNGQAEESLNSEIGRFTSKETRGGDTVEYPSIADVFSDLEELFDV